MFSIGDFAKLGRVSVRMLRHYDAIGLLPPAAVDPASGYRSYRADQLGRLNRLLALKDLGLTLQQVQAILDNQVTGDELRGMLRLRQAQLRAQLTADAGRLTRVETRLAMISEESIMTTEDVVMKGLGPVRIAELTGIARSYEPADIGPVIQPLYPELFSRLESAGLQPAGPTMAYYEPVPGDSGQVVVHAGVPIAATEPGGAGSGGPGPAGAGVAIVDLPAVDAAASIIHRGPMDNVMPSLQAVASWIEDNGYQLLGCHREVYLDYCPDDPAKGVTELQVPIVRQSGP